MQEEGVIIHISTNNFCGHGFYQFSPNLFHTFYNEDQGLKKQKLFCVKHLTQKLV